ncbi:gluconate 2-dehydrogenase subunit 3 family protein [Croceiramulus getboli]|nr:gluconate 2-dehydrogenase subunit 3 family protein [Flavobacteriaceae bacterium YJPT1-3]
MDRRNSIKALVLGTVAGGLALHGCKPEGEEAAVEAINIPENELFGRTPEEQEQIAELQAEQFFNDHELETLTVLSDLILPASDTAGSASEAGVPDFIEFMAKDYPPFQLKLRGGLMWLDHTSNTVFGAEFKSLTEAQQKEILDEIAFPDPKIPGNQQPPAVQFFSLVRNLTMTGYYTSKIGIEDLGYKGNQPNVWDGVPQEVLDQHGVAYEPEWLSKCIDQNTRGEIARWDADGNLLS